MINCCKPSIGQGEAAAALDVLRSGKLVQGAKVAEFEHVVAEYVQVKHAIACSSGTTALHLALMGMGVKAGDEVLVPAFTFVATANAVIACEARPQLCDINLDDFCIEPPRMIEVGTKMISVDAFGVKAHHYGVLEDAACALGSFKGLRGRAATLSFHATKVITTGGEGGMVLTDDADLAARCRFLRDQKHGAGMAYNYRMTEMAAAVGIVQMSRIDWMLKRRSAIAGSYDLGLDGKIEAIIPCAGNYQSYVLLFDRERNRSAVIAQLAERGVEALPGTQFLGDMPHLLTPGLPNARYAGSHAMRIPIWPDMTDEQVELVIEAVREVLGA